ncbi:alpha/beta fold hydrolase [Pseudalkalibacillus hwajinpoensis]|uniref:alpha/beta fold hydrolase n=1 Tax=Guptibacillus hwajinpoensis TaxID=208199 RepID=UPI001CD5744C|nr:alpha/beta hydrolase [Pseudalkalibacillus hwajinpoensis]MCA0992718.1 alpha/beta hydrolase [Pseudalkalibacillus hwajinpoensis]
MPFMNLEDDLELYYEDVGMGSPVIFIHGVWMSSRFFKKQLPYFRQKYRAISLDLRGHGQSSHVQTGHTVANYARDLKKFIDELHLKEVTLVGWSMGAFVIWEYLHQFGEDNVKGTVIVDELASDFKWPDFDIGAFDLPALTGMMRDIQSDQKALLQGFIPLMFKEDRSQSELEWMLAETTKMPASIASAILFDQSIIDCRPYLNQITKPTLLCFGKEEKLIPVAAGEHLEREIPNAKLVLFEDSCHCPFIEEAERFNRIVDEFIGSLN